jgi:Ca2+-binding RTX toxin-like protein
VSKNRFHTASPSEDYITYYGPTFTLDDHSGSSVTLFDWNGGAITLKGKGFAFTGDHEIVRGTVSSIVFGNEEGAIFARSTGHNFRIAEAAGDDGLSIGELISAMLAKNDVITGSKDSDILYGEFGNDRIDAGAGNDTVYGQLGDDKITGGKGRDLFVVGIWNGHTVITDFDANGGGEQQDYMYAYGHDFEEKKKGKDLLLIFDDDTRVTLLGVSKAEFDSSDFGI